MRKLHLRILIAVVVLASGLLLGGGNMITLWRVHHALERAGFADVHGGKATWNNGQLVLTDIKVNRDGFSVIEQMRIGGASIPFAALTGKWPRIIIDRAVLNFDSGDISTARTPSPYALPTLFKKRSIQDVVINDIQFDINSPAGAIRINTKAQITALPDGSVRFQSVFSGAQYQLTSTITANGEISNDNTFAIDFEIQDGKVNIGPITASRIGGWVVMNGQAKSPAAINGQISAGQFIAIGIPMNDLNALIKGTTSSTSIEWQASLARARDANITAATQWNKFELTSSNIKISADDAADVLSAFANSAFNPNNKSSQTYESPESRSGITILATLDKSSTTPAYNITAATPNGTAWMDAQWRKGSTMTELDIRRLDLQHLPPVAGWKNTSMTGIATGLIGLVHTTDDGLHIHDAMFQTTSPGTIRFNAKTIPNFMKTDAKAASLLKSFDYGLIELHMDGAAYGPLQTSITIGGRTATNQTRPDIITLSSDKELPIILGLTKKD